MRVERAVRDVVDVRDPGVLRLLRRLDGPDAALRR